jgi:hypothetical protein
VVQQIEGMVGQVVHFLGKLLTVFAIFSDNYFKFRGIRRCSRFYPAAGLAAKPSLSTTAAAG